MTNKQVSWAKTHDWFLDDLGDGSIAVMDVSIDRLGVTHRSVRVYRCYRALRRWAGY